jgi:hypothetical protein
MLDAYRQGCGEGKCDPEAREHKHKKSMIPLVFEYMQKFTRQAHTKYDF